MRASLPNELDIPQITEAEWARAHRVVPATQPKPVPGGVVFLVFRNVRDPSWFAVTDEAHIARLPQWTGPGEWREFRAIAEIGAPRVAFSESVAKKDIAEKGYHLIDVLRLLSDPAPGLIAGSQ